MSIANTLQIGVEKTSDILNHIVFYPIPLLDGAFAPFIVLWLAAGVLFCTFKFYDVVIRHFKDGFRILFSRNAPENDPTAPGAFTNFQALAASLCATLGLGNIAGVAVGMSIGGAGAAFWIMAMGLLCMAVKFCEATLAVKYREQLDNGEYTGGPVYYLKNGLRELGMPRFGRFMAGFFAICCIVSTLCGVNIFQVQQTYTQVVEVTGGENSWWVSQSILFGCILALMTGLVIIGGLRQIVKFASALTPIMIAGYLLAGIVVIAVNYKNIGYAFNVIVTDAFSLKAGVGALLTAIVWGVRRAIFSNESVLGTAGIMHAPVRAHSPLPVGYTAMLGAFFDTVIICMVTALVLVFADVLPETRGTAGAGGIELTSRAFATVLPWYPYVLAATVFVFAYSTLVTWFYYGLNALRYLIGTNKWTDRGYSLVYLLIIPATCGASVATIIDLADAVLFLMAVPNLVGLVLLSGVIRKEYKSYIQRTDK